MRVDEAYQGVGGAVYGWAGARRKRARLGLRGVHGSRARPFTAPHPAPRVGTRGTLHRSARIHRLDACG
jgi:hypothetical protein